MQDEDPWHNYAEQRRQDTFLVISFEAVVSACLPRIYMWALVLPWTDRLGTSPDAARIFEREKPIPYSPIALQTKKCMKTSLKNEKNESNEIYLQMFLRTDKRPSSCGLSKGPVVCCRASFIRASRRPFIDMTLQVHHDRKENNEGLSNFLKEEVTFWMMMLPRLIEKRYLLWSAVHVSFQSTLRWSVCQRRRREKSEEGAFFVQDQVQPVKKNVFPTEPLITFVDEIKSAWSDLEYWCCPWC